MAKKVFKGRKTEQENQQPPQPTNKSASRPLTLASLSNLRPPRGSRHRKVRVGRGIGSKLGQDFRFPATRDKNPVAATRAPPRI